MSDPRPAAGGASQAAIEAHYDVGNAFYALWLDPTMVYTAAAWSADPAEALETAQTRKVDGHLARLGLQPGQRVLDIGCGWGGALRRATATFGAAQGVGLTLSPSQKAWIDAWGDPQLEIRLEGWEAYEPAEPFDAIMSIEAFEAFARQGLTSAQKVAIYSHFFASCHKWLKPGGKLALQVITYGNAGPEDFDSFIGAEIFPESDLPRVAEIAEAIERRFEIRSVTNDRAGYARTLRAWLANLKARRAEAVADVGEDVVVRFERYLRLSIYMFEAGTCDLLRFELARIDKPRPTGTVLPRGPAASSYTASR